MSGSLTVGLLAHVDAGKTTLSEAMLYQSGTLRRLGRVDHRDAFLDTDVQERERGITIFSKQAELSWQGRAITLVDTPGHVDFSGETERALRVLDCAVLVISAADGVQGHTATLWRLLQSYHVPTFLFINKMDQPGANRRALMEELKNRLSDGCVDMLSPDRMEQIATCSEESLAHYLQDEVVPDALIAQLTAQRLLFPCFFGSALRLDGIDALLNALCSLLPAPQWPQDFSARIYKISRDPQGARLTWLKITGGSLRVRALLSGLSPDASGGAWEEKISQLRIYSGAKFRTVEQAEAGLIPAGQIHPLAVIVNLHGEGHDVIAKLNVHGRAYLAILHGNFNHRLAAFLGLQGGGAVAIQHAAQRAAVLRHGNLRAGRHILRGISQRRGAQQEGRRQRQQKQHDSFHYSFSQAALRARQQMAAAAVRQTASVR